MASIKDQIALITGASAGFGAATARTFAAEGAHVILAARRVARIEALAAEIRQEFGVDALPVVLDVREPDRVAAAIDSLPQRWAAIDILVNNAGLSRGMDRLYEASIQDWEEMIDTNVKGLLYVSRAVLPGMVARGRGHVVNIGSIAGREAYPGGSVYCATKAAVAMLTRTLRMDLSGTPIRVTCIEPGLCETEFSIVRFHGDAERATKVYQGLQPLVAADIADAILWVVTRPPHVNVQDMLIMPVAQASPTMVHRKA